MTWIPVGTLHHNFLLDLKKLKAESKRDVSVLQSREQTAGMPALGMNNSLGFTLKFSTANLNNMCMESLFESLPLIDPVLFATLQCFTRPTLLFFCVSSVAQICWHLSTWRKPIRVSISRTRFRNVSDTSQLALLRTSMPRTVRKTEPEWEQVSTNAIPKEVGAAGSVESHDDGKRHFFFLSAVSEATHDEWTVRQILVHLGLFSGIKSLRADVTEFHARQDIVLTDEEITSFDSRRPEGVAFDDKNKHRV